MKHLITLFFLIFALEGIGQLNSADTCHESFFKNGIHLNNFSSTIPWDLKLDDVAKFGKPKLDTINHRRIFVHWDSVNILNNIECRLEVIFPKKPFRNGKYHKMKGIWATVRPEDFQKLEALFESCAKKLARLSNSKSSTYLIENCLVNLFKKARWKNRMFILKGTPNGS